jgi:hypothetical protein
MQADAMAARLRARLDQAAVTGVAVTVVELARNRHEIAVAFALAQDEHADGGLVFQPHEIDNGASGVTDRVMRILQRYIDPKVEVPAEPPVETAPNPFAGAMTTSHFAFTRPAAEQEPRESREPADDQE